MVTLTLEQIAELAGVSRSTVSRVINGHISVSPQVRQRVQEVIQETGYQPNAAARSLAGQRTRLIGLVIPRIVQSVFTDPYFPRLIQGITQACNKHDYTLSLFLFHSEAEEEKLFPRVVRTRLLDGVIIASAVLGDTIIDQLLENEAPFVVIGRPSMERTSYVDVDNRTGAYTAVNHLIRLGHQRVATITGPLNTNAGIDRRCGYLEALDANGLPHEADLIIEGDFTEAGGYLSMRRLLRHTPDAVFVASDSMAMGALRALRDANMSAPEQIALVSFDDLPPATTSNPPLTTVRQPIQRLGAQAVDTLLDIIEAGPNPPRRIMMATELIIRTSCGSNQSSR